jgi:predicted enzyme related to lactoylglutathione lyase
MITTDFSTGAPCWLDMGVRSVSAAKEFYGGVFGWTLDRFGPDDDAYGLFKNDGKTVAAVGPLDEDARSGWMVYFRTPDLDETAEEVRRLGGTVRMGPSEVDDQGRLAQFSDPQGGRFAAWQPGKTPGLESVDEPGSLMWVELYTTDSGAAKEFYKRLYGWQYSEMPVPDDPDTTYVMITPAGEEQERMHGGLMQVPQEALALAGGDPFWHPVFHVTDCDGAAARVGELGGSVVMGPQDTEGVGRMAVCLDPFGADFVVLTPSM